MTETEKRARNQIARNERQLARNATWLRWFGWFDRLLGAPLGTADSELREVHAELLQVVGETYGR